VKKELENTQQQLERLEQRDNENEEAKKLDKQLNEMLEEQNVKDDSDVVEIPEISVRQKQQKKKLASDSESDKRVVITREFGKRRATTLAMFSPESKKFRLSAKSSDKGKKSSNKQQLQQALDESRLEDEERQQKELENTIALMDSSLENISMEIQIKTCTKVRSDYPSFEL